MPYNYFKDFMKACNEEQNRIFPINNVLKDAKEHFKLRTKSDLLGFIANDGLEDLQDVNKAPWKKDPEETVYGYKFRTNCILGYIAIIKTKKTGNWLIKSFHLSDDSSDIMKVAFKNAGLIDYRRIT